MSNLEKTDTTPTKRDFDRVDYDIEKTLYPDPPNDAFNELNASHQVEKSYMMHRVPTESLEEIPSLRKEEPAAISTSIDMTTTPHNAEAISTDDDDDDDDDEEKKKKSKFHVFRQRHKKWFQ